MHDFLSQHATVVVLGVVGLVILLIVVGVINSVVASRRRKTNLQQWAFRGGFDYQEGPLPGRELAPLAEFEVKDSVTRVEARNVARGSRGVPVTFLDLYRTTVSHPGINRTQYTTKAKSCALFKLSDPLPRFSFSALTTKGKDTMTGRLMTATVGLATTVGGADAANVIPIDNRPGFILSAPDVENVRPLFAADRVSFFDDKCGWSVEADGTWMLISCEPMVYGHGWPRTSLVDERRVDEFLNVAQSIMRHLT